MKDRRIGDVRIPSDLTSFEAHYIAASNFVARFKRLNYELQEYTYGQECSLLEVGCQEGILFKFLEANGHNNLSLYGVDIDENNISKVNSNGYDAKKCDLNFEKIPYADKTFDCVVAFEVIEHVPFYHNLMFEIARVLKDRGLLFLTTPNVLSLRRRVKFLFGYDVHKVYSKTQNDVHYRMFSLNSIQKLLTMYNFQCRSSTILNATKNNHTRLLKNIFKNLSDIIFVKSEKNA